MLKKIEENCPKWTFLQSEIEPVGSFLVVTFHPPTTVDKASCLIQTQLINFRNIVC